MTMKANVASVVTAAWEMVPTCLCKHICRKQSASFGVTKIIALAVLSRKVENNVRTNGTVPFEESYSQFTFGTDRTNYPAAVINFLIL